MNELFERTISLIGEKNFKLIQDKTIAVFGLGGVGGTALESLSRTGFEKFIICDFDMVSASNINRQILYTSQDIGKKKTICAKTRIESINLKVEIEAIDTRINEESIRYLDGKKIDFIVDAIDDVNGKIALAKFASEHNIPLIVSLGMANRYDPSKVSIVRLDKTTNDPLAKKMRYEIKKNGLQTNAIMAVCSSETPMHDGVKLNSIMSVPSAAGLNIAAYVLDYFIKK